MASLAAEEGKLAFTGYVQYTFKRNASKKKKIRTESGREASPGYAEGTDSAGGTGRPILHLHFVLKLKLYGIRERIYEIAALNRIVLCRSKFGRQ